MRLVRQSTNQGLVPGRSKPNSPPFFRKARLGRLSQKAFAVLGCVMSKLLSDVRQHATLWMDVPFRL